MTEQELPISWDEAAARMETVAKDPLWERLDEHCLAMLSAGAPAQAVEVLDELIRFLIGSMNDPAWQTCPEAKAGWIQEKLIDSILELDATFIAEHPGCLLTPAEERAWLDRIAVLYHRELRFRIRASTTEQKYRNYLKWKLSVSQPVAHSDVGVAS